MGDEDDGDDASAALLGALESAFVVKFSQDAWVCLLVSAAVALALAPLAAFVLLFSAHTYCLPPPPGHGDAGYSGFIRHSI